MTCSLKRKIKEKFIYAIINNLFLKSNVFNQNKFFFQSGKSAEHATIRLLDTLYETIKKDKPSIAVFDEFRKSFDSINHNILNKQLELIGIRGRAP